MYSNNNSNNKNSNSNNDDNNNNNNNNDNNIKNNNSNNVIMIVSRVIRNKSENKNGKTTCNPNLKQQYLIIFELRLCRVSLVFQYLDLTRSIS